ncbi:MAG: cadmium-translocating P-type ATPase [Candidatus Methanoplasma sp.]|jgi:Cd2+/Zn2+-exporting ATPase|nr:cadmium-translocating P-type ATPase [Candidatus Methanoplasma sp.]
MFGADRVARIIAAAVFFAVGIIADLRFEYELAIFGAAYAIVGYDVLLEAAADIWHRKPFNENLLMAIASLGAFAIGEHMEGTAVLLFYQIGELFQDYAVNRSRGSIKSLMEMMPDSANLVTPDGVVAVGPQDVHIGDAIVVRPGERIPLDGTVVEGRSMVDTSSLTGESVPRDASVGDAVLSGCICVNGALTVSVTSEYEDSAAMRIMSMMDEAYGRKSRSEDFVTKFARYYTPAVVVAALMLAILPPLILGGAFETWLYRALMFLVISCPCAVVISVPLAFFGGIGGASRAGILVKGGNYLDALAGVDTVVFDKTGTLTEGVFEVLSVHPVGIEKEELIRLAAHAETDSNHPIAAGILRAHAGETKRSNVKGMEEIRGKGVAAFVEGRTVVLGSSCLMEEHGVRPIPPEEFGTAVHIAVDGAYVGYMIISDRVRKDSAHAVSELKRMGIGRVCMLTGDCERVGRHVAEELGIDEVFTDLLPGDKMAIVDRLIGEGRKVAFVGDGVNDAPSLARSDVGIAMGALGSDAAIEAADVVITDDMPSKVSTAIRISKRTRSIAIENIVFALAVKAVFLSMGALGYITLIEAVFADVGVAVIAILNSMRALRAPRVRKHAEEGSGRALPKDPAALMQEHI